MYIEQVNARPEAQNSASLITKAIPELSRRVSINKIDRGQNNPTVSLYKVRGKENLIIKSFDQAHLGDAQRDLDQYNAISSLPFISRLTYARAVAGYTFLAYEWIEGIDLFDYFRTKEGQDISIRRDLLRSTIDQTLEMGNAVTPDFYQKLKEKGTKVSVANPLYKGLVSPEEEERFADDYKVVDSELNAACEKFPGLYIDRNPGNTILQKKRREKRLYQVDFGRMEGTSPLFDLGMLFRQQTGEPSIRDLDADPTTYVPTYNSQTERELVSYTYDKFSSQSQFPWNGTKDEFIRAFKYIAFRNHIYFLTKAEGLIRSGETNSRVQEGRKIFHKRMLHESFNELIDMGEPVEVLKPWIDRFTNL